MRSIHHFHYDLDVIARYSVYALYHTSLSLSRFLIQINSAPNYYAQKMYLTYVLD